MAFRVITHAEQPGLLESCGDLFDDVWPEYNLHGDVLNQYWGRLYDVFAEFQFLLYDEARHSVVAGGHTVPCRWDGTIEGLPAGIDGLVVDGFELRRKGASPNTLAALAVEIPPRYQAMRLSTVVLTTMRDIASEHGFRSIIVPVRPSWKDRYPLTPIESYVRWTRDDGQPFDPWIRVHHRMGAQILKPEPRSLVITGTISEWEEWTQMRFPESGDYVFPEGLAPVAINVEEDRGVYWEPNVWISHVVIER